MKHFKLALIAIILIFGCVFANMDFDTETAESERAYPSGHSSSSSGSHATQAPTKAPTKAPTHAPTTKPGKSTPAPTKAPTKAPTTKPSSTTKAASSSTTGSSSTSVGLCDIVPTSQEPIKLLVPLYVYPGSEWDTVAAGASSVATIAIINPNSGPDASGPDSSYNTYMTKLANAGVEMIGYVHTSYGDRAISDVEADIATYASKYPGLKGIFFDEASDSASELSYYTSLYNYVLQKGYTVSILNPGTQPDAGYVDISTSIVVFEDASSRLPSSYSSFVTCAPSSAEKSGYKYKFSAIAYGAASSSASSLISKMHSSGVGMVYVTDGAAGCCTYNDLVSYYSSEVSAIKALN